MFEDYIINIIIYGLNYCLIIAAFIFVLRSNNRKIYILSILIGFTVYGLTFIPAFSTQTVQLQEWYLRHLEIIKTSPPLISMFAANFFIAAWTFYKKNYLENFRRYLLTASLGSYLLFATSVISVEVELLLSAIVFIISIGIIWYRIDQEDKDNKKYQGKNLIKHTPKN